jgi:hypothetical protein
MHFGKPINTYDSVIPLLNGLLTIHRRLTIRTPINIDDDLLVHLALSLPDLKVLQGAGMITNALANSIGLDRSFH